MASLDDLYSKLSLGDDDDTEAYLDESGTKEIQVKKTSCLATKMLLRRPYNLDAMRTMFMKVWQLNDGLEIKETTERVFLFYFDDLDVQAKVWLCQSWSFNKSLLVFAKVADDGSIDENDFKLCPFWLQLQGLPTHLMTEKVSELLRVGLGKLLRLMLMMVSLLEGSGLELGFLLM